MTDLEAYHQLTYYTASHQDPAFLHQLIVDAYAVQHATPESRPVYASYGLAGLYLHTVHGFTGKMVQQAHMKLAKLGASRPLFDLPDNRGDMSVFDVLKTTPGTERDAAIESWNRTTWEALPAKLQREVAEWLQGEIDISVGLPVER